MIMSIGVWLKTVQVKHVSVQESSIVHECPETIHRTNPNVFAAVLLAMSLAMKCSSLGSFIKFTHITSKVFTRSPSCNL